MQQLHQQAASAAAAAAAAKAQQQQAQQAQQAQQQQPYAGYPGYGGAPPYGATAGYPGYGAPPAAAPAPQASAWAEHYTAEGHMYYFNSTTGASSWERPAEMDKGRPRPGGGTKTKGPPGANLFVVRKMRRGEFDEFSDQDMRDAFSRFGNIVRCEITIDKDTGLSKGFGFVSYDHPACADAAIASLNGTMVGGRQVRIEKTSEDGAAARPW